MNTGLLLVTEHFYTLVLFHISKGSSYFFDHWLWLSLAAVLINSSFWLNYWNICDQDCKNVCNLVRKVPKISPKYTRGKSYQQKATVLLGRSSPVMTEMQQDFFFKQTTTSKPLHINCVLCISLAFTPALLSFTSFWVGPSMFNILIRTQVSCLGHLHTLPVEQELVQPEWD